jgi:endo-1,4-beta-xylanase
MIDRRRLLAAAAAATAMASSAACASVRLPGAREGVEAEPSLHDLAAAKGLVFGSATGMGEAGSLAGSQHDPAYRALLARECGMLVCENEMKWYSVRPRQDVFEVSGAQVIADFATEHAMALRGHTLLWHHPQWFPQWLTDYDFGPTPAASAEAIVTDHVRRLCERFPQVVSWDVVNETVDPATGGLRETSLSRAMGLEVLDLAFHTARAAAPKAELTYNDYMSWEAGHETHRAGVLRLLEGFRARGVPIDTLGVQSHIGSGNDANSVGFNTAQEKEWSRFIDEVTGMGLKIAITEFDVHDKNLPADIPSRDHEVAALGRAYLDLMLDYPQTRTVVAWGLSDRYSWLQGMWPRADGLPKRPNPFDGDDKPKPLRAAIADAFKAASPRPTA